MFQWALPHIYLKTGLDLTVISLLQLKPAAGVTRLKLKLRLWSVPSNAELRSGRQRWGRETGMRSESRKEP
jgi:hypothetical protein